MWISHRKRSQYFAFNGWYLGKVTSKRHFFFKIRKTQSWNVTHLFPPFYFFHQWLALH